MSHKQIVKICFLTLIYILDLTKEADGCKDCNQTYKPPCNMKFPYGDEYEMNTDVLANDTNRILCRDKEDYTPEYGRCPFPPADPDDMTLTNPYITCPEFPPLPVPGQLPVGAPLESASAKCKTCDVKLTPDGAAVHLKCTGCHDLPSTENIAELDEKDLVYTVYYVEIANYTSVYVRGKENINP